MTQTDMPTYDQMMQPTLDALRKLSRQASGPESADQVTSMLRLSPETVSVPHGSDSKLTELEYRLMWTRTYLKRVGLIDNPERGYWTLTETGQQTQTVDPKAGVRTVRAQMKAERDGDGETDLLVEGASAESPLSDSSAVEKVELKSQTPLYPTYESARYFLQVLDGVPYAQYREMDNDIRSQRGNPQQQVDWANPDEWISPLRPLRPTGRLAALTTHVLGTHFVRPCALLLNRLSTETGKHHVAPSASGTHRTAGALTAVFGFVPPAFKSMVNEVLWALATMALCSLPHKKQNQLRSADIGQR